MSKLIVLRGIPASGKTTWAKGQVNADPNVKRVNRDELRDMIDNGHYTPRNEEIIKKIIDDMIIKFIQLGYDVIVDNTNLSKKDELHWKALIMSLNEQEFFLEEPCELEFKYFPLDLDTALKRNQERGNKIPEERIKKMHEMYLEITAGSSIY